MGREHPLAANRADFAADWVDAIKAFFAHRETGNVGKRHTANAAVRRKEHSKKACGSLAGPSAGLMQNNRGPCLWNRGSASPDSVLTTAEDCLQLRRTVSIAVRENTHVRTALHMQYSGVPCR